MQEGGKGFESPECRIQRTTRQWRTGSVDRCVNWQPFHAARNLATERRTGKIGEVSPVGELVGRGWDREGTSNTLLPCAAVIRLGQHDVTVQLLAHRVEFLHHGVTQSRSSDTLQSANFPTVMTGLAKVFFKLLNV